MADVGQHQVQDISIWRHYGLPERSPIEARMPVVESSIIQTAPGPSDTGATIVTNGDVTVAHSLIRPRSIGVLILKEGYTCFFFPRRWVGEISVNGVIAEPDVIHLPADELAYYVYGQEREIIGSILPRTRFIETIAALRGVDPDKVKLHQHAMELTPAASSYVRNGLETILSMSPDSDDALTSSSSSFDLSNVVFELMADMYLYVRPEVMRKSGRVRNPGQIVRAAEERFASAMGAPVSLADLCMAAGVSKSVLYLAFQQWCGESPLSFFHKRRLSRARTHLLNADFRRGAVKQAALSVGLTELGRFSRDYRLLFGEQPSATLNKSVIDSDSSQ